MTAVAAPDQEAAAGSDADATSLSLLNACGLRRGGAAIALPMSAQRLLAFLALHEHPVRRVYVAGTLYIDTTEDRASANLRSSLWRLHQPGLRLVDATTVDLRLAPGVRV